jgi:hypothetical protein
MASFMQIRWRVEPGLGKPDVGLLSVSSWMATTDLRPGHNETGMKRLGDELEYTSASDRPLFLFGGIVRQLLE